MNEWVKANGEVTPSDWDPTGLPTDGEWTNSCGCESFNPETNSTVDTITLTGKPGTITGIPWRLTFGATAFTVDYLGSDGSFLQSPLTINDDNSVSVLQDPVDPLDVATKGYVDNKSGLIDAPSDGSSYGRRNGAWNPVLPLTGGVVSGGTAFTAGIILASPSNLNLGGGTAGQVLTKAGLAGQVAWSDVPPSGIPDAPGDGNTYGRRNFDWEIVDEFPEAPFDGQTYGRQDGAWTPVTGGGGSSVTVSDTPPISPKLGDLWWDSVGGQLYVWYTDANSSQWVAASNSTGSAGGGGGGLPDAPNDGTAYARKSAAWANLTHLDISDWAATLAPYALTSAVPIASASNPIMDSVAAPGVATTFARGDHVHPSDTSKVNLSGGTFTGRVFLNSDPTLVLEAATKQYADRAAPNGNRIINGDMVISQRGVGPTSAINTAYTLDRWFLTVGVNSRGTWSRITAASGGANAAAGLAYTFNWTTAATAYTPVAGDVFTLTQRIEGVNCMDLAWGTTSAQPISISFWINVSTAGNYSVSVGDPGRTRSYAFSFNVPTANTWTRIAFTVPGDQTGTVWATFNSTAFLELRFDLGAHANQRTTGGSWQAGYFVGVTGTQSPALVANAAWNIGKVKLELGSQATPWVFQTYQKTLADCLRYYQISTGISIVVLANGSFFGMNTMVSFPVPMRIAPATNITAVTPGGGFTGSVATQLLTNYSYSMTPTATQTSAAGYVSWSVNLDAEL